MSCFSGSFSSLPGVRCDRFERLTGGGGMTAADQFFLSHCHTDHMVGLDELGQFLRRKARGSRINHKLYCSAISKAFMKDRFKIPDKAIVELMPNDPKTVHVYDSDEIYKLKITAIGANHCPGSLMFLFERLDGEGSVCKRILYTGDFRYDTDAPLTHLEYLHDQRGQPLNIDEMYLDTTFCSEQYETFPTRHEAEEKIWEQCDKWIKRNGIYKNTRNKYVILLTLPARYGYERILRYVYERSNFTRRVHVNADKYDEYLCMNELSECTEPDPGSAPWIHACTLYKKDQRKQTEPLRKTLPCQPGEFEVCQIKPSATFFTKSKMNMLSRAGLDRVMSVSQGGDYYRICYSCHSSLTELKTFVQHFSPLKIRPCAIPRNSSREEVMYLLDTCLGRTRVHDSPSPVFPPATQTFLEYSPVLSHQSREKPQDSLDWMTASPEKKSLDQNIGTTVSTESRVSFDEFMDMDETVLDSSEDETEKEPAWRNNIEIIPGILSPQDLPESSLNTKPSCTITPTSAADETTMSARRRTFALSRVEKTYYSMPLHQEVYVPKERRFSMPSNMKLPLIKVTPSSPCPDPDDPDYPEFFQGHLYLQQMRRNVETGEGRQNTGLQETREDSPFYLQEAGESGPYSPQETREVGPVSPLRDLSLTLSDEEEQEEVQEEPEVSILRGNPKRIKRQQSMFRTSLDEEDNPPLKKPKIVDDEDTNNESHTRPEKMDESSEEKRKVTFDDRVKILPFPEIEITKITHFEQMTAEPDLRNAPRSSPVFGGNRRKLTLGCLSPDNREISLHYSRRILVPETQDFSGVVDIDGGTCGQGDVERVDDKAEDDTERIGTKRKREKSSAGAELKNYLEVSPATTEDRRCPTPDIDELIENAVRDNLPEHMIQTLRHIAEIRKNVVQID